jgi:plastocyanin
MAACGGDDGGNPGDPSPPAPPTSIDITTGASPPPRFIPASTTLASGGTVRWTNGSPADHDLVATTPNWQLNEPLPIGGNFQTTISQAGTYGYECTIHPGMVASIEVR